MTTMELEIEVQEFAKTIDSKELLQKLKAYATKLRAKNPPCQYTVEEMKTILVKAKVDQKNCCHKSIDEVFAKYDR